MIAPRLSLLAVLSALVTVSIGAFATAEDAPRGGEAKPDALDIIDADAKLAIAIRNVEDLTRRGDEFLEKTEFKSTFRLSDGYRLVTTWLGIHGGLDKEGSAALMMLDEDEIQSLVLAVPISDTKDMAANFGLKPEDLAEGAVVDRKERGDRRDDIDYVRYLTVRGRHLLIGGHRESVKAAAEGKSLRDVLPKRDAATLADDDILTYANVVGNEHVAHSVAEELEKWRSDVSNETREALRRLAAAAKDLRYVVGGARLDEGLGASLLLQFEGETSREVLSTFQSSSARMTLAGLPGGRVVAAHASSGEGERSAAVAAVLVEFALKSLSVDTDPVVAAAHHPNVVGVFGEVWHRLLGSRSALYQNENPGRDGVFSLLAVLETDDAEKFLVDMQDLARFVNVSSLSDDDLAAGIDSKTVAALIEQLGAPEYRLRQSAMTKLGLIGAPVLPALEAAQKSPDAEVRYRAGALRATIQATIAQQRDELVRRDLLSKLRPNFGYFPKQEMRGGRPIDIVQMRLSADESPYAVQLRELLGPQWSKLRMATVGKRVVVLAGSNTALLDEAIVSLQKDESGDGLQEDERFARYRARADREPTAEFHLSLAQAQAAISPTPPSDVPAAAPLTSFGATIAPQRVRIDFFAPLEEVRSVVKRLPW
ncbi:MAG: hypothetical protein RIC55_07790 [Pirellulaceae bacterium]